jgi:hypothetical protein
MFLLSSPGRVKQREPSRRLRYHNRRVRPLVHEWSFGLVARALEGKWLYSLLSRTNAGELTRVLGYAKFRLSQDDRRELLGDYLP